MVNNNFYATINELVAQATSGTASAVVDYSSFIDAGRTITELSGTDVQNNFIAAIANKMALSINTARSYLGKYKELTRGQITAGNTIEMIMNTFYDAQAAAFVDLVDGQSVDQYTINKPKAYVDYFIDTNTYQIPLTIQRTQLVKAFQSPAAMDSFLTGTMTYLLNSNEAIRENARIGLVAKLILDVSDTTPATSADAPAQVYKLVSLYNALTGLQLTSDNCMLNEGFVKYMYQTIAKVMSKTENQSSSYNKKGIKTFTPGDARHLFINTAVSSAFRTYIFSSNNIRPEAIDLSNYIDVPYWQNEKTPFTVKGKVSEDGDEITSSPIAAVFCDKFAIGEYLREQTMDVTPFNAKGKYWNNFLNVEVMYVQNQYANAVVFTLD